MTLNSRDDQGRFQKNFKGGSFFKRGFHTPKGPPKLLLCEVDPGGLAIGF